MRFLLDMCIDIRVVAWLRQHGHDAKHLREEGLHRLPNGKIFDKAIAEKRVIITFDLDFAEIAALSGSRIASVIILRLSNARTVHVIDRLAATLPRVMPALEKGAIVAIEESRHRIRELPIGGTGNQA